jgi:hypothetical protein
VGDAGLQALLEEEKRMRVSGRADYADNGPRIVREVEEMVQQKLTCRGEAKMFKAIENQQERARMPVSVRLAMGAD